MKPSEKEEQHETNTMFDCHFPPMPVLAEDVPSYFEVHYINNREFYGQTTINARGDEFITISSAIQENDSDPDYDYQKVRYQITEEDVQKGIKKLRSLCSRESWTIFQLYSPLVRDFHLHEQMV